MLPTLFTVGNLFCGFTSVVQASQGRFGSAALLVLLAALLDGLDGRIARLTGTASEFGIQFDSLADIVSFGIAPAFLVHQWALVSLGKRGWLIAFLFVVCAAMRLARFNIQMHVADTRWFVGLASPAAAAVLTCMAFAFPGPLRTTGPAVLVAAFVVVTALLMVSRIRYRSFKDVDLRRPRSYMSVLVMAAVVVGILLVDPENPALTLFVLACAYMASGPVSYLWSLVGRGRGRAAPRPEDVEVERPRVLDGRATR